jgi:hypothetical protein
MGSDVTTLAERFGKDRLRAFEHAADRRFEEAEILRANGRYLMAIYLYGYVIEIYLKAACFRFYGCSVSQEITEEYRRDVAAKARIYGIDVPGPHDLLNWARLLVESIQTRSRRTNPILLRGVSTQALIAHQHWRPEMRYRATTASEKECEAVRFASDWFAINYTKILGV